MNKKICTFFYSTCNYERTAFIVSRKVNCIGCDFEKYNIIVFLTPVHFLWGYLNTVIFKTQPICGGITPKK